MSLIAFAPAKINLYLHVTGKRADGYHLLDSLVAFTSLGDEVQLTPSASFGFTIIGPMAGRLNEESPDSNLVVRAAKQLAAAVGRPPDFHLTLVKTLPIASGIGGGSSDAAAALRLVATHFGLAKNDPRLTAIAASLGSDIPCCLAMESCHLQDIGTTTIPAPALPLTHMVLVNPNQALPTPAVYKARQGSFSPAAPLAKAPKDSVDLAAMLAERHNDLTAAASTLLPVIPHILQAIKDTKDCLLARMSGSGATCFGLYASAETAAAAAKTLQQQHPDWWVKPCFLPYAASE